MRQSQECCLGEERIGSRPRLGFPCCSQHHVAAHQAHGTLGHPPLQQAAESLAERRTGKSLAGRKLCRLATQEIAGERDVEMAVVGSER